MDNTFDWFDTFHKQIYYTTDANSQKIRDENQAKFVLEMIASMVEQNKMDENDAIPLIKRLGIYDIYTKEKNGGGGETHPAEGGASE